MGIFLLLAACSSNDNDDPPPTATNPPAEDTSAPVVAWVEGGNLFIWQTGLPRRIASGAVIRPYLAPDGAWVAYLRGPGGDPRSLWISDSAGSAERQLVVTDQLAAEDESQNEPRRIGQVVWSRRAARLYFNTLVGNGMSTRPADDLWRVDINTGTLERILPDGEGGQIFAAPDGGHLALASAGQYDDTPAQIAFLNLDTRRRTVMLQYPAVATASESRWYPALRWLPNSTGAMVAIPPPDLVYGGVDLATALWWLPVDSNAVERDAVQRGQVNADYFGLPTFSADGQWLLYAEQRSAPTATTVTWNVAQSDGTAPQKVISGELATLTAPRWLPAGAHFSLLTGDNWLLAHPGGEPAPLVSATGQPSELRWADGETYVLVTASGLTWGRLDEAPQPITTLEAFPLLDAVIEQR